MKKVLVISAHPDDETLGAGGTILKHINNLDEVYWLIVTSMEINQGFSKKRIHERDNEIKEVAKLYGFKKTYRLGYPTSTLTLNDTPGLINKISSILNQIHPEIIYTVNRSDAHSDHRIVFESLMACSKSFRAPFIKRILMYECISETEFSPALPDRAFVPNYFVDISETLKIKLKILELYRSELAEHPFPRSKKNVKSLAIHRGATVGVRYAEAFQLLKFIDK